MSSLTNKEGFLIKNVVNYTDERIINWYKNAKIDYNVNGSGKTHYNHSTKEIVVEYVENGVRNTWKMCFYPEYVQYGLDWVFNCWAELYLDEQK